MGHQISRSIGLSSIPERKKLDILKDIIGNCSVCSKNPRAKINGGACKECSLKTEYIRRYADANIPILYWNLEMDSDFVGFPGLKIKYQEITKDLKSAYKNGIAVCFAGSHGVGKTLTVCNILKRAVENDFSSLYVNLGDIIAILLNSNDLEDKTLARRELLMVDFLVIDEFDARYMSSDKSSDLFGKILEEIFRTRSQNKLPTLMCTNTIDVVKSFNGPIKESIQSLMNTVELFPVLGKDQRMVKKK